MTTPLIAICTFIAVVAGLVGLYPVVARLWQGEARVRRRVAREFGTEPAEEPGLAAFKDLRRVAEKVEADGPPGVRRRFAAMVEKSGLGVTPRHLLAVAALVALGVGGAVGLWKQNLVLGAGAGAVGFAVPLMVARFRAQRRDLKLLEQLPEIMDLMARFLKAGHSLPQALKAAADEFRAPAGELFGRCVTQQELGLPADSALRELAEAADLAEYRIVILAILVQQQSGGSLAEVCERLAGVVRERFRVRGMIQALTAEGRMQAKVLMVLPVFLFLAMMALKPDYADALLATPKLLIGIAVAQLIGVLWIRRIVNVSF